MSPNFDFSLFSSVPGFDVLRADNELWLDQPSINRTYYISSPRRGEFCLCYSSDVQWARCFVMLSDSLHRILSAVGALHTCGHRQNRLKDAAGNSARLF